MDLERILNVIDSAWPIMVGLVGLVVVLAKMHGEITMLREKVSVLFELWNKTRKDD